MKDVKKLQLDVQKILLTALKAAVGATLATLLAGALGLSGSMTAGIIAILSIQNTKRATWKTAAERGVAFVVATLLAFACLSLLGFGWVGFAVYLFLYAMVCASLGWMHALSTISVLVTHYVAAGEITWALIGNEALLLVIGATIGMVVNLHLHPRKKALATLADAMDEAMRTALHALADQPENDAPFQILADRLQEAQALADDNRNNRLLQTDDEMQAYVLLRQEQARVLRRMREEMRQLTAHPAQYVQVCDLLHTVADAYHRNNDVRLLMEEQQRVLGEMKQQPLPVTREEFENRAILYVVLTRLEEFLSLKRAYYLRRMVGQGGKSAQDN